VSIGRAGAAQPSRERSRAKHGTFCLGRLRSAGRPSGSPLFLNSLQSSSSLVRLALFSAFPHYATKSGLAEVTGGGS